MLRLTIRTLLVSVAVSAGLAAQSPGPSIFAPGVISVPESHDDYISLSADGRTAVFTRLAPGYRGGTIYLADFTGGTWSNVRVTPFSGTHQDSRASFSPDGQRNGQWSSGGPADIMQMPVSRVPQLERFYR
jgi:hypothetical protein